jgi:hypothetical protein
VQEAARQRPGRAERVTRLIRQPKMAATLPRLGSVLERVVSAEALDLAGEMEDPAIQTALLTRSTDASA